MWKNIKIDGNEFVLKHNICGTSHELCITDFIELWFENIEDDQLLHRCKELNKLIETSDDVFKGYIWSLLHSESDDIVRNLTTIGDGSKTLMLQKDLDGLKFRVKLFLNPGSHSKMYDVMTRPLLTLVAELERRHELLVEAVKSKDLEILEYKLEGGQISRKAVETTPFDLNAFSSKCAEDINITKSNVIIHPSQAFTSLTKDLLERIEVAPILPLSKKSPEEKKQNIHKTSTVKLTSPSINKKLKIYDDDEDEDIDMNPKIKQEESLEVRKVDQNKPRQSKRKQISKKLLNL